MHLFLFILYINKIILLKLFIQLNSELKYLNIIFYIYYCIIKNINLINRITHLH